MESDTERGVGSFGNDGEELSPMMTITSLNRGMDSIVAKAGTLPTLKNVAGITSFERKFKSALEATPFGCYPSSAAFHITRFGRYHERRRIRALSRAPSDSSAVLVVVAACIGANGTRDAAPQRWIMGYVDESVLALVLKCYRRVVAGDDLCFSMSDEKFLFGCMGQPNLHVSSGLHMQLCTKHTTMGARPSVKRIQNGSNRSDQIISSPMTPMFFL